MTADQTLFPADFAASFARIVAILRDGHHPFAVSGALAQNVWGIPRTSGDIDFLMVCPAIRIPGLIERLVEDAGARIDLRDALESLRREFVLRFECAGVPCELFVPYLPFHTAVLARAVARPILGVADVPVVTAEDMIILKVLFDRDQDWADVEGILARWSAAGSDLDFDYLGGWVAQMVPESNPRVPRLEGLVRTIAARPDWRVHETSPG